MPGAEIRPQQSLPLNELTAISTLDGRDRPRVIELTPYVSEYNIIRTRTEVESVFLIALSEIGIVRPFSDKEKNILRNLGPELSLEDAWQIKRIEDDTAHDVTAMVRGFRLKLQGSSLKDVVELVHYGITSADIDNISYRLILRRVTDQVFIPILDRVTDEFILRADQEKRTPILARTHGQPAVTTTLGKEFAVFASKLSKEVRELAHRPLTGKLTGAVGNLNALQKAHPEIDWLAFSKKFVRSFGFEPNLTTTQINPYEDVITYFQSYQRINGILLDFNQDLWRYISDNWFVQEARGKETGSSTMPQKVNPWRLENSEGNLEKANNSFDGYVRVLGQSRLQRDNSDSTWIREMGVPLGWSLLAYKNLLDQLSRIKTNPDQIRQDLNKDWTILSEVAQVIMRGLGIEDPYSLMMDLTRGRHIGKTEWEELVEQLPIPDEQKRKLSELTPETYLGLAVEITERTIEEIRALRNN